MYIYIYIYIETHFYVQHQVHITVKRIIYGYN